MSGVSRDEFVTAKRKAVAALQNEEQTRQRVDSLEKWAEAVSVVLTGSFRRRLRWLILGR